MRGVGPDSRELVLVHEGGVGDGGERERAPRRSGRHDEDDVGHEGGRVLPPGGRHAAGGAVLRIHPPDSGLAENSSYDTAW